MDRLDLVQAFVAVAEAGSFSTAATRLALARVTVSKRVAALERLLGVRLLARTTRRVGLTGEGAEFLPRAQRVLAEFEDAVDQLGRQHGETRGRLKVAAPMSFGTQHLAPVVADFAARHPALRIELELGDGFVDLVRESFDLALRIADLPDSSLIARRIAPVRIWACAAPAYLQRHGAPRTPAELEGHRCLRYGYMTSGPRWHLERAGERALVPAGDGFVANNGEVLARAAEAGLGIALLPTFIVGDALRAGRLVRILEAWEVPRFALYAVWAPGGRPAARVRALVDFLLGRFGDPPYWDQGI